MSKKILLIFGIVIILTSIPAAVYLIRQKQELRMRAAPATTLSFSLASVTKDVGQTFSLGIVIDTGTNQVSAAELHITFDPQYLKGISITPGTFLPVVLVQGNIFDGNASIILGAQPTEPKQGTGTLATITFTALNPTATTPTYIKFQETSQVAGIGEQGNVLASTSPASVVIAATLTPTPVPTVEPTRTPTPVPALEPTTTPSPTTPVAELPKAGFVLPTFGTILGGILLIGLALILAF